MDADEVIARYALAPHPEGGHYREIYRAVAEDGGRGAVTAIYYLLRSGEVSHWHRVDAVEIWHYHAGAGAQARALARRNRDQRPPARGRGRRGTPGGGSRRHLAERALRGRLDAGGLHGRAGLRVLGLRAGSSRLAAGADG